MNIAYACNRHYLYHTMVSIYSLLANGRGGRPARILLAASQDVGKEDLKPITQIVSHFPGCSLTAVWPQEKTDRRFAFDALNDFDAEAVQICYYRLFLPDLLPGEDRCLYLDSDTVICRPLTKLYDTDFSGASLAGVTDRLCLEREQVGRMKADWSIDPGYYINSGVILMDLQKMRSSENPERALELAYLKPFRYMDQDVLNQIYQGEVLLLPKQYNVFPDDVPQDLEVLRKLLPEHAELFSEEALRAPAVIHYIGKDKPWNCREIAMARYWHEAESGYRSMIF